MKSLLLLWTCFTCAVVIYALPVDYNSQGTSISSQPKQGTALDEVVVESSLYIKNKKNQGRRTRDTQELIPSDPSALRVKRQHRGRRPQNSHSSANAADNDNYFGKNEFGGSAANAQAQGFISGQFGANAANTQTQSFNVGPDGLKGSAGASLSQVYTLPNGKTINVAFSNGVSTGPNANADSNANAITIT